MRRDYCRSLDAKIAIAQIRPERPRLHYRLREQIKFKIYEFFQDDLRIPIICRLSFSKLSISSCKGIPISLQYKTFRSSVFISHILATLGPIVVASKISILKLRNELALAFYDTGYKEII